jgi:hypothetical protein
MKRSRDEFTRFFDPDDWLGLRTWACPDRSRLLRRLKKLVPRDTILDRRGMHLLRDYFGDRVLDLGFNTMSYGVMRLVAIDWVTDFQVLGFFRREEVEEYARVHGPPDQTVLSHFWYGLKGGDRPGEIERILLWRPDPNLEKRLLASVARRGW